MIISLTSTSGIDNGALNDSVFSSMQASEASIISCSLSEGVDESTGTYGCPAFTAPKKATICNGDI
ncbi:hypothetical protein D3C79_1021950 [compost metagenome]